ncbi:hypothetical protein PR048_024218 [Dryococelus australis]|uniref:Uncharacterized protein n=1 Tax=Dryococelus australis TaxID=614101 RepID=A0ABQ9GMY4_9NEOP|nr:hypothetical protein PR048_024218 [Dryococelus australis]
MPLVAGIFSGISRFPALSFRRCYILTSITFIGSQNLAVRVATWRSIKAPVYMQLYSPFVAEEHGSYKGDTATHIKYIIAAKCKTLNWRTLNRQLGGGLKPVAHLPSMPEPELALENAGQSGANAHTYSKTYSNCEMSEFGYDFAMPIVLVNSHVPRQVPRGQQTVFFCVRRQFAATEAVCGGFLSGGGGRRGPSFECIQVATAAAQKSRFSNLNAFPMCPSPRAVDHSSDLCALAGVMALGCDYNTALRLGAMTLLDARGSVALIHMLLRLSPLKVDNSSLVVVWVSLRTGFESRIFAFENVLDDASCRRVFSGISSFPPPLAIRRCTHFRFLSPTTRVVAESTPGRLKNKFRQKSEETSGTTTLHCSSPSIKADLFLNRRRGRTEPWQNTVRQEEGGKKPPCDDAAVTAGGGGGTDPHSRPDFGHSISEIVSRHYVADTHEAARNSSRYSLFACRERGRGREGEREEERGEERGEGEGGGRRERGEGGREEGGMEREGGRERRDGEREGMEERGGEDERGEKRREMRGDEGE